MEDSRATKGLLKAPSKLPQYQGGQPQPRTSPSKLHATAKQGVGSSATLIPRPASPAQAAMQRASVDGPRLRSSAEVPGRMLGLKQGAPAPSILQKPNPAGPMVPKINFSKLHAPKDGPGSGGPSQLPEPEACASPCRHRETDDHDQGEWLVSRMPATRQASTVQLARVSNSPSSPAKAVRTSNQRQPGQSPTQLRSSTATQARPSSPATSPELIRSKAKAVEDSPSPNIRKSNSRLQAEGMMPEQAPRRAGSADKSMAKNKTTAPTETRASFLRRSASADKKHAAQNNNPVLKGNAAPARATSAARGSLNAPGTYSRPHPPAEPRINATREANPAVRHRLVGSPLPNRTPTTGGTVLRGANGSPARRVGANAADPTPTRNQATKPAVTPPSILSTIQERTRNAGTRLTPVDRMGQRPTPPGMHAAHPPAAGNQTAQRPAVPRMSLNLGALRATPEPATPSPPMTEHSVPVVASVPRLNLAPVMQQHAAENPTCDAYVVAPAEAESPKAGKKSGSKKITPPSPPQDHFYFYPRVDPVEERRTLEKLEKLPKYLQKDFKRIFTESIQAKQNCEAIAFRGHRLLDQMNSHHKERDKMATERNEQQAQQILELSEAYERQQWELERLRAQLSQASLAQNVTSSMANVDMQRSQRLPAHAPTASSMALPSMSSASDAPDTPAHGHVCPMAIKDALEAVDEQLQNISVAKHVVEQHSMRMGGSTYRPGAARHGEAERQAVAAQLHRAATPPAAAVRAGSLQHASTLQPPAEDRGVVESLNWGKTPVPETFAAADADVAGAQDQDFTLGDAMEQLRKSIRSQRQTDDLLPQHDVV